MAIIASGSRTRGTGTGHNSIVIVSGSLYFISSSFTGSMLGAGGVPSTSSGQWEVDPDDGGSIQFRVPKEKFGGTNDRIAFYISSSGKIGIGTKDPETAFDVRDNTEDADPKDRTAKTEIFKISKTTQTFDTPVTASVVSASTSIETAIYYGSNIGSIYEDYIYLTPTDFDHVTDKVGITVAGEIEGDGGSIADNNARATYHAQKIIPKGYKATHAMVKGSSASDEFRVFSSSYDVSTAAAVSNAGDPNTELALTSNVIGGNGNYVSIMWATRGNQKLYGGYIKLIKS